MKLEVGQPLRPGVTRYPELPEYNYLSGGHGLVLYLLDITPAEREAVRRAPVKLAFAVIGDVLFFLYRFGTEIPWSDASYTWHKVPPEWQVRPPALTGEQRILLTIALVEASTGIVEAIRVVTMSPTMSRALHLAINRQADAPFPADYDEQVRRVYAATTSNQLRRRAIASCTGGDTMDRPSPY